MENLVKTYFEIFSNKDIKGLKNLMMKIRLLRFQHTNNND